MKGRKADEAGCSHNHTVDLKSWVLRAPLSEFTARGQEGGISAVCWVGAAASRLMTEPKQKEKNKNAKLEQILFLRHNPAAPCHGGRPSCTNNRHKSESRTPNQTKNLAVTKKKVENASKITEKNFVHSEFIFGKKGKGEGGD